MQDPMCKPCQLTPEQAAELRRAKQLLESANTDLARLQACGEDCRAEMAASDVVAAKVDALLREFGSEMSGGATNAGKRGGSRRS